MPKNMTKSWKAFQNNLFLFIHIPTQKNKHDIFSLLIGYFIHIKSSNLMYYYLHWTLHASLSKHFMFSIKQFGRWFAQSCNLFIQSGHVSKLFNNISAYWIIQKKISFYFHLYDAPWYVYTFLCWRNI